MTVFRYPDNPIIGPKDVKPCSDEFEVVGVFNAAVARFADEVILLLRVAERPISKHPDIVLAGIYDVADGKSGRKNFRETSRKTIFPIRDLSKPRTKYT